MAPAFLGLLAGITLCVVVVQLPRSLERQWHALTGAASIDVSSSLRSVWSQPWRLVSGLGWGWMAAVVASCVLATLWSSEHYGQWLSWFGALVFLWSLIGLSAIDLRHQLLPDALTLSLMWAGLLINTGGVFTDPVYSVIGAAAGYGCLWLVYQIFRLFTGKDGMGYGDFKLLAAMGAWLGLHALPLIVFIASVFGVVVGGVLVLSRRLDRDQPMPFGPLLAAGGVVALLVGPQWWGIYTRYVLALIS